MEGWYINLEFDRDPVSRVKLVCFWLISIVEHFARLKFRSLVLDFVKDFFFFFIHNEETGLLNLLVNMQSVYRFIWARIEFDELFLLYTMYLLGD